jgi:predicted ATPase
MTRILSLAPKKFFFVGCCRDDEMEEGHAFYKMLEIVRGVGVNVTTVKIGCIEEDALNSVISDLLCLSPRMVRSLSKVVHSKTKGNPLFVSQLLRSLNRDGLLRVDLSSKQWVWDKEKILSTKLPDNIALCFQLRFN